MRAKSALAAGSSTTSEQCLYHTVPSEVCRQVVSFSASSAAVVIAEAQASQATSGGLGCYRGAARRPSDVEIDAPAHMPCQLRFELFSVVVSSTPNPSFKRALDYKT